MDKFMGYSWLFIWTFFYILFLIFGWDALYASMGFDHIGMKNFYRVFTGIFCHVKFVHYMVNIMGYFFIANYLLEIVDGWKIFTLGLVSALIEEIIYAFIYPETLSTVGGSSVTFALIGLIIYIQLFHPNPPSLDAFRIKKMADQTLIVVGSLRGNWIVLYSIMTNIPVGLVTKKSILCHLISLLVGFFLSFFIIK